MITLVRWFKLKSKEVKYKLAFYTFLDKTVKEINTGELKERFLKELMPYLADVIHSTNQVTKENDTK